MKHKPCKVCHDKPQPVEIVPGWTWYPSCPRCGRKAVNVNELSPEEFGHMLAVEADDAYRKVFKEFFKR